VARKFRDPKLLIASHNRGKVGEIAALLRPYAVEVVSAAEAGLAEPEETGDSFVANAELKARAAAATTGTPALADDSGLAVAALGGRPGILSARWGGPERDFGAAMRKVWQAMPPEAERDAHFVCALSLCWPDGHCETFEGVVHGSLVWPPRGGNGHGYDPIFVPAGHSLTFGEMDTAAKDEISHRADAFRKLVRACFDG
jgi:XTP/dITP diphosphohydrolase